MSDAMAERPIAIQMTGISRMFRKLCAVDDLDLSVRQGELFSLLGPNGAGKTTTIKMLCCLLKPSSGTATIMGHDIQKDPLAVKQIIDVSPQETALSEHLNAWDNLSLTGRSHGLEKSVVQQRSQELLEMMGLMDRAKERVKRFSGGMKRRLSIAMALVSDPQVLFLDEPTLGLDPQSRAAMWEHINQIKGSKTVMLTTHYLEEADSLADRIAIFIDQRYAGAWRRHTHGAGLDRHSRQVTDQADGLGLAIAVADGHAERAFEGFYRLDVEWLACGQGVLERNAVVRQIGKLREQTILGGCATQLGHLVFFQQFKIALAVEASVIHQLRCA